jgi:hypothetical protein
MSADDDEDEDQEEDGVYELLKDGTDHGNEIKAAKDTRALSPQTSPVDLDQEEDFDDLYSKDI